MLNSSLICKQSGVICLSLYNLQFPQFTNSPFFYNFSDFHFSRPHKHPDGTRSTGRVIWEYFHKNVGRLGLVLALINISLGLFLAVVPVAAWAVWFALLGTFAILYVVMEIRLQMSRRQTKTHAFPMK